MKYIQLWIGSVLLPAIGVAQTPCGVAGVSVTLTPPTIVAGEDITITVENNSSQAITFPTTCTLNAVYAGGMCSGVPVYLPVCGQSPHVLPPNSSESVQWNQLALDGTPLVPGDYAIEVLYFDGFTMETCCLPVEIRSEFEILCNGDGGNQLGCTSCPCGNDTTPGFVGGCTNGDLRSAVLEGTGAPSVSDDTLRFRLRGATSSSFAILFSGAAIAPTNPANPCFGLGSGVTSNILDGLRCAVQDVQRHGTRSTSASGDAGTGIPGTGESGWGPPDSPTAGLIAQNGFVAGQTRFFQAIYRTDPASGCQTGQNTSQALRVDVRA